MCPRVLCDEFVPQHRAVVAVREHGEGVLADRPVGDLNRSTMVWGAFSAVTS